MKKLCVGGEFYDVLEYMGYQPSTGYYAKRVRWGKDGVRVAVASSLRGPWRFWAQVDAVQLPLSKRPPARFW